MKICNNAQYCCYGNIYYQNVCGYNDNLEQDDECPQHAELADFYNAHPDFLYAKSFLRNTNY